MARTIAVILGLIVVTVSLLSQQSTVPTRRLNFITPVAGGGGCTVTTNPIVVTLLTNMSATSNNNFYVCPAVTPLADGDTILVIAAYSPVSVGAFLTNQGATQLNWPFVNIWQTNRYARTNYATAAYTLAAWITQLRPGESPFSMNPVLTVTNGTGVELIVLNVSGADTNLLWGQNAIHQVASASSNSVLNARVDWATPGGNGSNAMIMAIANNLNSLVDETNGTGFTRIYEGAHNTPAMGLFVQYTNNIPTATTFGTNRTISGTPSWGAIAIEIRAGTNACGYEDPLTIPKPNSLTVTNFYVDTASSAGGTGTVSNDVSSADRAFASLKEALESNSLDGSASNKFRVIWCKGVTNDTNICLQATWDSVTTTPTTRIYIVGDNTTGTNNPNTYKIASTNNNIIYNNKPGHVWMYNIVALGRSTTATANNYTCFRLATANVGSGRTDCDVRFINCGAVITTNGAPDDIWGFQDSDFAVNDARNRCKRINCWATGGTYGFAAADAGPFQTENYNCTSVSNEFNFIDPQLIQNCLGAYPTVGNSFEGVSHGQGFTSWNATTDTSLLYYTKNSRVSQTPTFLGPFMYLITSSDTSSKDVGLNDPLSGVFRFDVLGATRTGQWSIGMNEP